MPPTSGHHLRENTRRKPSTGRLAGRGRHHPVDYRDVCSLVHSLRTEDGVPDPSSVARELGITVLTRSMTESLWGLTIDAETVWVNSGLHSADRRFAIAHEIAHVLVRRGKARPPGITAEEAFADAFADALLSE
jgi:hypothetical protein